MARIINQIITTSTAKGFKETGQQVEDLSKKQTRLANESTNTGRAFSAQASGLGGLVAAYAGAAATTFALQQSFSALSSAARAQALIEGVTSIAQSLGQNGPKMISTLKEITRGQLSIAESAQNIGIALSAGLAGDQIEQLADIATRASKVLGRDLTDSIQRLVRGVGKLEPELLDELGIFTRIEPAVERYAARLGRAASSLTNFERRQAFANAVIEEGTSKYRNVDTSVADSSQNLNKLAANLTDLATKIGQTLVNMIDPIISFLNKDITNLAGLLVLLGTLIFSKLGEVTKQGINNFTQNIDKFAANVTNRFTQTSKAAELFSQKALEAQRAALDITSLRSLAGPGAESSETRAAIRRIREGNIAPSEIPALQATLRKTIASEEVVSKSKLKGTALDTAPPTARMIQLENLVSKLGETSQAASPKVTALGGAITGVGRAVSIAATGIGRFLGVLGNIAMGYAILDFFATLVSLITGIENPLNKMLVGVSKLFSDLVERFTVARRANDAFLGSFTQGEDDIKKSAASIELYNKALQTANDSFKKVVSAREIITVDESRILTRTEAEAEATQAFRLGKEQENLQQREKLVKSFNNAQTESEREQYELAIQLLDKKATAYFEYFDKVAAANGRFTKDLEDKLTKVQIAALNKLGISFEDSRKLAQEGLITFNENNDLVIKVLDNMGATVSKETQTLKYLDDNGFKPLAASSLLVETNIIKLSRAISENGINADVLSGFIANLKKEQDSLGNAFFHINPHLSGYGERLKTVIERFSILRDEVVKTEQDQKDLNDVFGSSIKLAGSLIQSGLIGGAGFATTSEQQKTNQLLFLKSIQESSKDISSLIETEAKAREEVIKLEKEGVSDRDTRLILARSKLLQVRQELTTASNVNKAYLGEYLSFARQIDQIYKAEQKRTMELENQLETLQFQNQVIERQGQEELKQLQARLSIEEKRFALEVKSVQAALADKRLEKEKLLLDLDIQANERAKQRLETEQELKNVQSEKNKLAIAGAAQPGILSMQRDLGLMQAFGGLASSRTQEAIQMQLQIREKEVELAQTYEDIRLASEKNLNAALLDKDSADLRLRIAQEEQTAVIGRNRAEVARVQAEFAIRREELDERKRALEASRQSVTDTGLATMMQIRHDEDMYNFELELNRQRINQINKQAEIFSSHTNALAKIFGLEVGSKRALPGMSAEDRNTLVEEATKEFTDIVGNTTGRVTALTAFQSANEANMRNIFGARRDAAAAAYRAGEGRIGAELGSVGKQQKQLSVLEQAQLKLIRLEGELAKKRADGAVDTAAEEQKLADLRFNIRQTELQNEATRLKQQKERQEADLMFTKEMAALKSNNLFGALSESIGIFRDKTTDFITTMLTDVINGTAKAKDVFKKFMLDLLLEIQRTIIRRNISEPIATGIADILGKGLTDAASKQGDILGKGLTDAFLARRQGDMIKADRYATPAIGGEIKRMASGGPSGRDRVFALLEPGEYVIRRPAAMAIGKRNLDHLNAMGPNKFEIGGGLSDIGGGSFEAGGGSDYSIGSVTSEPLGGFYSSGSDYLSTLVNDVLSGPSQSLGGFYSSGSDYLSTLANDMLSGPSQSSGFSLGDFISSAFTNSTIGSVVTGITDIFSGNKSVSEVIESVAEKAFDVERGGISNIMSMGLPFGANFVIGSLLDLISGLPGERIYPSGDGRAIGGYIRQMAAGGYANLRDSVPALLEPGEFVIRKPMAKAIGGSILNQMNATGQMPVGNVMVNVNNQGTPQTVQGTPKITRQGENIVIDIIVKDIQNNGPIRQTLRGMR